MDFNVDDFRFYQPIEIRWNDLDPLGHVNNVLYFDYFQHARGYYITEVSKTWDWKKDMFVIANTNCNYLKEIKLDVNKPKIGVRMIKLGNKSFTLEYVIISEGEGRSIIVHAKGESTQVLIDMRNKCTIELPEWFIAEFKTYEPTL